ncbi:MAG: hypothetical protein ABI740_10800 [Alphaproteobacteria bacterium]
MKTIGMLAAASIAVVASLGGSAFAQQQMVKISIDKGADYEQSLKCYQYYDVAEQVANAMAAKAAADSDDLKVQQGRAAADKALKAAWNRQIDATKASKSNKTVDSDLAKTGGPVIADANGALKGDSAASGRYDALQVKCKTFERVEQVNG